MNTMDRATLFKVRDFDINAGGSAPGKPILAIDARIFCSLRVDAISSASPQRMGFTYRLTFFLIERAGQANIFSGNQDHNAEWIHE